MLEYEDLANIESAECGEALIALDGLSSNLICRPINGDMQAFCGPKTLVRKSVAEKLVRIAEVLRRSDWGVSLVVVYGLRAPALQERYFEQKFSKLKATHAALSAAELRRLTHRFIASPDVAGHPTGGAVDVTLWRDGKSLPMGGEIWDLSDGELIPTFSGKVSPEERQNRLWLRGLMQNERFAPFDGEWWHFSYGDKEWAALYKEPRALYEPLSPPMP